MRTFIADRQWGQYHTPKNLAMALAGEAGELVAEFQWMTPQEATRSAMTAEQLAAIEAEMADVLIYLVVLADQLGTSLPQAVEEKMARNAIRFPPVEPQVDS
ncbi:MAG: nucleotide pyrophosphohydrolase [Acidimicrobiales bacterium]